MNLLKRLSVFAVAASILSGYASAEIPAGYYDSCEGKTGEALLKALNAKIKSHTTVSYAGLWELYKTSDIDENGKIWDMYSTKRWTPGTEQCGNYSAVGDCYNREHSFPKSWFDDKSPMVSDGFHIYPTDGKVNGQRSNYPFGECANGTTLSSSGSVKALGKLGASTFSGYSGTVFEPVDEYKGDFARSYFYMAACYGDVCSSWAGSAMINNTSYPFFTDWAKNMLMKWTRLDEVSQKELNRQEAVYAKQKNRNPFIDHPELAEYIWGDKNGTPWHSNAEETADILQPAINETIDLGISAINVPVEKSITLKTRAIKQGVVLGTYPSSFVASPEWFEPADANAGTPVTITYTGSSAGTFYGTLSVMADDLEMDVDMKVTIVDGLPIYDASNVTSESFVVRWVNIGDASTYTLDVRQGTQSISGYPVDVNAASCSHTVTGLDPETTYTFQLSSNNISSEIKSVTTTQLFPSIEILFDGNLHFDAEPGQPSAVAELLLDIENVAEDINVAVKSPFEVSTDKSSWSTSITLDPEEDRFYMRVNSAAEGEFTTSIVVTAGDYMTDDAEASATVTDPSSVAFIETFNVSKDYAADFGPYVSNKEIQGIACKWMLNGGGLAQEGVKEGTQASYGVRLRLSKGGTIAMNEDKAGGLGTVTFEASKWNNTSDGEANIEVEYSTDGGSNWKSAGNAKVSATTFNAFSVPVNVAGNGRIRLRQTSGDRWIVDNISISNYSELMAVSELDYHSWDAFCRNGALIVECQERAEQVAIYGVDGITWVNDRLEAGEHRFDLPKGLYIVVAGDFSRRVLVK